MGKYQPIEAAGRARSFVARQPIFDRRLHVCGYELLFRSGPVNRFRDEDPDRASRKVIADGSLLQDVRKLAAGKPAWINITRDVLLAGDIRLLPPTAVVVELLESIEPDEVVIRACRELRDAGYRFAVDDFVDHPRWDPLLDLAHYVKVDFLDGPDERHAAIARRLAGRGVVLLAEKVETYEVLARARELGYTCFQGFFFSRPEMVTSTELPAARSHLASILSEVHRPSIDYDELERVIQRDPALCYRLLRYINAACHGLRQPVSSIRRGIILLGTREIVRWATLSAMTMIARDSVPEVVRQGMVRARFCETLAPMFDLQERADDLFLVGLLSVLDAALGVSMDDVVRSLPVADDLKGALLGRSNELRRVFDFNLVYERGGWEQLAVDEEFESRTVELYLEAVEWGSRISMV